MSIFRRSALRRGVVPLQLASLWASRNLYGTLEMQLLPIIVLMRRENILVSFENCIGTPRLEGMKGRGNEGQRG